MVAGRRTNLLAVFTTAVVIRLADDVDGGRRRLAAGGLGTGGLITVPRESLSEYTPLDSVPVDDTMSSLRPLKVPLLLGATRWLADLLGHSGFAFATGFDALTALHGFAWAGAESFDDVTRQLDDGLVGSLREPDRIVLVTIFNRLLRLTARTGSPDAAGTWRRLDIAAWLSSGSRSRRADRAEGSTRAS